MSSNGSGGGDQPSEGCGDTLVLGEMPGEVPAGSSFTGTSKNKWNGLELARAAEADDRPVTEDERLLEELLRLKLTSSAVVPEAVTGASSLLPPKQRIKLFQPRTKMEQFEDILIESQLFESSPELATSAVETLALAGLPNVDGGPATSFGAAAVSGLLDFDATDAIFCDSDQCIDDSPSEYQMPEPDDVNNVESVDNGGGGAGGSECSCAACHNRAQMEAEKRAEVERLRQSWVEVREQICKVYQNALKSGAGDCSQEMLSIVKPRVLELCLKDPHQLFQRLETGVRDIVVDIKLKLIELLQKQAKNPSLAQDFIQSLLESYERLCSAAQQVSPALIDLEMKHLNRFSFTWEVFNKHLYQCVIYADPMIQNNLPIFISQLRSLYPDKEHEAKYTELVRGYLDFDVEMEQVGAFWRHSDSLLKDFNNQQNELRKRQKMFREDLEKFKKTKLAEGPSKRSLDFASSDVEDPNCECDVCSEQRLTMMGEQLMKGSFEDTSATNSIVDFLSSLAGAAAGDTDPVKAAGPANQDTSTNGDTGTSNNPELTDSEAAAAAQLYKHLCKESFRGNGEKQSGTSPKQGLAALFPSLLTAEGLKPTTNAKATDKSTTLHGGSTASSSANQVSGTSTANLASSVAAELSQALSTALSLSVGQSSADSKSAESGAPTSAAALKTTSARLPASTQPPSSTTKDQKQPISGTGLKSSVKVPINAANSLPTAVCTTSSTASSASSCSSSAAVAATSPVPGAARSSNPSPPQPRPRGIVASASSSQSTLPPGKCNSYTNHLTGSKELNQLLHQHYCGKKAPPKPSASAVKRGKVPPPPNHVPTKNCPVQQKKSAAATADTDAETANTKNNPEVTDKKLPAPPVTSGVDVGSVATEEEEEEEEDDEDDLIDECDEDEEECLECVDYAEDQELTGDGEDEDEDESSSRTTSSSTNATNSLTSSGGAPAAGTHTGCQRAAAAQNGSGSNGDKQGHHHGETGNGKQCSCCCCEMFGHGGAGNAPMSRNYPEMRERLRILLNKKRKVKQPNAASKINQQPNCHKPPQPGTSSTSSPSNNNANIAKAPSQHPAVQKTHHPTPPPQQQTHLTTTTTHAAAVHTQQPQQPPQRNSVLKASASASNINTNVNLAAAAPRDKAGSSLQKSQSATQVKTQTQQQPVPQGQGRIPHGRGPLEPAEPAWTLEDSLDFIEGNSKSGSVNEKKKAKKERQRLQRLEEQKQKEEEEKRKREAEERERKRVEEEERKRAEVEYQLQKKKTKKEKQRAKKLAAKGGVGQPVSEDDKAPDVDDSPPSEAEQKVATTLEELRAQHQKELMVLQLQHQKALQEQERKLLEQQQLQQQQMLKGKATLKPTGQPEKATGGKNGKRGGKGGSKSGTPPVPPPSTTSSQVSKQTGSKENKSVAAAPTGSILASANKTLAEAAKKPGHQIKITRTPNGGVEFTSVPIDPAPAPGPVGGGAAPPPPRSNSQAHLFNSSAAASPAPVMMGTSQPQQQQQNPFLRDMLNSNPSFGGGSAPAPPSTQPAAPARPSVPSQSNQPMVTIRRVDNPAATQPTVTISMKSDIKKANKSNPEGTDKLLYTLVNGEILKAKDAPENLIPSAKPMPKGMQVIQNGGSNRGGGVQPPPIQPQPVANRGGGGGQPGQQQPAPTRPPLPLDGQGKVDLDRLELPPGVSITKLNGPVPERRYFPSKPNGPPDHSGGGGGDFLPLPGQHSSQVNNWGGLRPTEGGMPWMGHQNPPPAPPPANPNAEYLVKAGIDPKHASNVIVVDTSSLATGDDGGDGKQQSSKASKSSKKRQRQKLLKEQHQKQEGGSLPQPHQAMSHQSSQNNTANIKNDLKSGPQVLIKNVNGKVVITPIPETQNPPPEPASLPATNNMNVKAMPQAVVRSAVGNGVTSAAKARSAAAAHGGKVVEKDVRNNNNNQNAATNNLTNGGGLGVGNQVTQSNQQTSQRTKKASLGDQNIDDFNSIFEPKDIDLENGDMDDDEKEIEAFRRFCFNSVPLQQKPKISFDMKNISLKKK